MKIDNDKLGCFKIGDVPILTTNKKSRKKSQLREQIEDLLNKEDSSYILYKNIEQKQISKMRGLVYLLNSEQRKNNNKKMLGLKNGSDDIGNKISVIFIKKETNETN